MMKVLVKNICSNCGKSKKLHLPSQFRCHCELVKNLEHRAKQKAAKERGEEPRGQFIIGGVERIAPKGPMTITPKRVVIGKRKDGTKIYGSKNVILSAFQMSQKKKAREWLKEQKRKKEIACQH